MKYLFIGSLVLLGACSSKSDLQETIKNAGVLGCMDLATAIANADGVTADTANALHDYCTKLDIVTKYGLGK